MMSEEKKDSEKEKTSENTASEKSSAKETGKKEPVETVDESKSAIDAAAKAEAAAKIAEAAEAAVAEAIAKAEAAKADAESAAEAEYKAITNEVKADIAKKSDYSFKRQGEEIFRREMSEPEFFLDKKDRFPRPILTPEQQASLTRTAETPKDQTPVYVPENILSPEFKGMSNYERGVDDFLNESKERFVKLKNDPESTEKEILNAVNDIKYLESLHENFYIGMNVFRTAKGGRSKIS